MIDLKELEKGILKGDRFSISKAITLLESSKPEHISLGGKLIENIEKKGKIGFRLGITGPPGVGKSSFIEKFGHAITDANLKLAVLAIDPSSPSTGGSILGDKTRMTDLSANPNVFIRPSPSKGSMGGIHYNADQVVSIFEAAGFDVIIIETVGVGQAETSLRSMVDYFLLLATPGGGDDLQGIKRGIMELVNGIALTKTDLYENSKIKSALNDFKQAFHFLHSDSTNQPIIMPCSSITGEGITDLWNSLHTEYNLTLNNGELIKKRSFNKVKYFETLLELGFKQFVEENKSLLEYIEKLSSHNSKG